MKRLDGFAAESGLALGLDAGSLVTVLFEGRLFPLELEVALVAAGVECAGIDRGFDRASGLPVMPAVPKTARVAERRDIGERVAK